MHPRVITWAMKLTVGNSSGTGDHWKANLTKERLSYLQGLDPGYVDLCRSIVEIGDNI